jgi:hypothetical protein
VIAGDQNSDPFDGDSVEGSAQLLLEHPRVNVSTTPSSLGAVEQSALQGGQNTTHEGNPAFDTADFADGPPGAVGPGNLRADYVLPSRSLSTRDAAVFWPRTIDPFFNLVGVFPFPSSDHKLVWVDVTLAGNDDDDEGDDDQATLTLVRLKPDPIARAALTIASWSASTSWSWVPARRDPPPRCISRAAVPASSSPTRPAFRATSRAAAV